MAKFKLIIVAFAVLLCTFTLSLRSYAQESDLTGIWSSYDKPNISFVLLQYDSISFIGAWVNTDSGCVYNGTGTFNSFTDEISITFSTDMDSTSCCGEFSYNGILSNGELVLAWSNSCCDTIGTSVFTSDGDGGLSAPTNFSSSIEECTTTSDSTKCNVSFSWTDVSAATGYKLYYGFSPGSYETPFDVGNVTSVTFNRIPEGTYYLAISAYDSSGNESGKSDEMVVTVSETSVPTNFIATVEECTTSALGDSCTVSLRWTGVSAASGYKLYYGYASGSYKAPFELGNVTSVTFDGVPGGTYYLALTSYDSEGIESGYSDEVIVEVGSDSSSVNDGGDDDNCPHDYNLSPFAR